MTSLRGIRQRLHTIKSISQVTAAMKLISTSNLRRYQHNLNMASQYYEHVNRTLHVLNGNIVDKPSLMTPKGENGPEILLVITSDKGLCGSYNEILSNRVNHLLKENPHLQLYVIGTRGFSLLNSAHGENIQFHAPLKEMDSFQKLQTLAHQLMDQYENGTLTSCKVLYTHFKSILVSTPQEETLFPLFLDQPSKEALLFDVDPNKPEVFKEVVRQYITANLYYMMQQSQVSEQATRMMAMDNSTRNAQDMLEDLGREYNRKRQQMITQEIMEIIGGAEAL